MSMMRIMGVDPASIRNLGVGIIDFDTEKKSFEVTVHTTEVFPDFETSGARLKYAYDKFAEYFDFYKPDILVSEQSMGFGKAFVRQNLQENCGVMKLCAHMHGIKINEISPKHIKLIIAGSGNAKKPEVIQAVRDFTGMAKSKTEHEADAVAAAIVYLIDEAIMPEIHEGTYKPRKEKVKKPRRTRKKK